VSGLSLSLRGAQTPRDPQVSLVIARDGETEAGWTRSTSQQLEIPDKVIPAPASLKTVG
jgi:hypothetical protein